MNRFHKLAVLFSIVLGGIPPAWAAPACGGSSEIENGYRQMYNLDFNTAHGTFQSFEEGHPNDPLAHVSNAAAYLFAEFDRMHVLEMELFADNSSFEKRAKVTPDPTTKASFERELAQSTTESREFG